MKQYAVTVVFYLRCEDEDQANMTVSEMINESYLNKRHNESVDIVDVSEVEF